MRLEKVSTIKSLHESGLLDSPEKIVAAGSIELLKVKNIGRKSLEIIASLLQERGYIENARKWFGYESETH
jgi:DNA-directed RNA polymerase alpha subunit